MSNPPTDAATQPPPSEVSAHFAEPALLMGSGSLTYFGFSVYEARLWAQAGFKAENYPRENLALELIYARKLEGKLIAERSLVEMRRIGNFDATQSSKWQSMMESAFPDVRSGDRLTGIFDGKGKVEFFYNGKLTGQFQDREFSQLFIGIWMDPKTSDPSMRRRLIGQK